LRALEAWSGRIWARMGSGPAAWLAAANVAAAEARAPRHLAGAMFGGKANRLGDYQPGATNACRVAVAVAHAIVADWPTWSGGPPK